MRCGVWLMSEITLMTHDLWERTRVKARKAIIKAENTIVWHELRILTIGKSLDVVEATEDFVGE